MYRDLHKSDLFVLFWDTLALLMIGLINKHCERQELIPVEHFNGKSN